MIYHLTAAVQGGLNSLSTKLSPAIILLAKTSTKKTTTSNSSVLIFYLLIVLMIGFFVFSRRMRAKSMAGSNSPYARNQGNQFLIGDVVATSFGLIGKVIDITDDNKVDLEIAPGVVVSVLRHAVARTLTPDEHYSGDQSASAYSESENYDSPKSDLNEETTKFQAKLDNSFSDDDNTNEELS
jgi:preprotein translocase subunit YajC